MESTCYVLTRVQILNQNMFGNMVEFCQILFIKGCFEKSLLEIACKQIHISIIFKVGRGVRTGVSEKIILLI